MFYASIHEAGMKKRNTQESFQSLVSVGILTKADQIMPIMLHETELRRPYVEAPDTV
jgi:hypothetical protein